VDSIDFLINIRAEIVTAIFQSFAEHKIKIPFPKRDLYLKSTPPAWAELLKSILRIGQNKTPIELKIKNPPRFKPQRINLKELQKCFILLF